MKKILTFLDNNLLKFGVAFAILFTALYPKLPSIHVERTWVYIRLEDFVILSLAIIWFIQLLRRKVTIPKPEGYTIILYWIVGLISLLYCLAFIAPSLANFFPQIAGLQYARRIEYMILFFIAFSTIKNVKDVYFHLITLCITVLGVVVYGLGQRFYMLVWSWFPDYFSRNPFCFPAFLTGNEEFAKGTPLCLNELSRVTSTFGGHYDLSAYMVLIIPILIALVFAVKRWWLKISLIVLAIASLEIMNLTSSRTSFVAYVIGIVAMFILWNRKRWILPVLIVSVAVMTLLGNSTIQRFTKTIQPVQVISTEQSLPADLKEIIAKTKRAEEIKSAEVPPASDFTLGNKKASASGYTAVLTEEQLKLIQSKELAISTVSGSFLIKRAYALDISFTTRFQGEWPRNWNAFLYSPVFGTGYSSLTLATDNDYLRALGETGLSGLLAFLFIFVVLGIFVKNIVPQVKDKIVNAYLFGLVGGTIGLLINAILIDVFEASKVAEPFWILAGIAVGAGYLFKSHAINYKTELLRFLSSKVMVLVYLLTIILAAYVGAIGNYFVADDFTWLKWASESRLSDIPSYFMSAQNFFYRPLDKTLVFFLFQVFDFNSPAGYHLFILFIHFLTTIGVFLLATRILNNRIFGLLTAVLFAIHPVHHENIFWFSTLSGTLSSCFIMYAVYLFLLFREKRSIFAYIAAFILSILAFMTYEIAVIIPLLLVSLDFFIVRPKRNKNFILPYVPFVLLVPLYFGIRIFANAFGGGGNYSYNLANLPFNFVGNYFGYLSLFFGTNNALPLYTTIRGALRDQLLIAAVILLLIAVVLGYLLYSQRKKMVRFFHNNYGLIGCFGLVFAAISLLPFLGLGNIAPRYFYLASFGFALAFMALLQFIATAVPQRLQKRILIIILIAVSLISIGYFKQNITMAQQWQKAGEITEGTLFYFRIDYTNFTNNTHVYFVDAPLKYSDAWLFPVGLQDALWVIYRDRLPVIHHVVSVEEAKKKINALQSTDNYIFQFDKEGKLIRVQ